MNSKIEIRVNEDGQLEAVVTTPFEVKREVLSRKQSEAYAIKVLESSKDIRAAMQTIADAMQPAIKAVETMVAAINALPPEMKAKLAEAAS